MKHSNKTNEDQWDSNMKKNRFFFKHHVQSFVLEHDEYGGPFTFCGCRICSTAEELLHLRTVLEHFGFRVNTTLYCDSVAARGIAQGAGLEKVKALAVKTLWLQEVVRDRGLQIKTIASKGNKADLGTKVLPVARLNTLRGACGVVVPGELSKHTVESETD